MILFLVGARGCISVAAWTHLKLASYYFASFGGLIVLLLKEGPSAFCSLRWLLEVFLAVAEFVDFRADGRLPFKWLYWILYCPLLAPLAQKEHKSRWWEGGATQKTGWNVIHDRLSSAFNIFVLDSKMAKQQLQSVFLVRRLDSCRRMFGCLPGCSETFKGWMARVYFECGSRSFRTTSILKYEKTIQN